MIEGLTPYISIAFLLTTLLTVWFLFSAAKGESRSSVPGRLFFFTVPFWMLLTGYLATTDFYRQPDQMPPRVVAFAVLPSLLFIALYFLFFRDFLRRLSLKTLTILHAVRLPVEIVLLWRTRLDRCLY